MSEADRQRWNRRYRARPWPASRPAASLALLEPLLRLRARWPPAAPGSASALDLACGSGRNALFLASLGYSVTAVDVADEALHLLAQEAIRTGVDVRTLQADLDTFRPCPGGYDLVVQAYFLDRGLWPHLAAALRPGGMLFVETFTEDRRFGAGRPGSRTHLLGRGELATAFPDLEVLFYSEQAERGVATLLAGNRGLDEQLRRQAERLRSSTSRRQPEG